MLGRDGCKRPKNVFYERGLRQWHCKWKWEIASGMASGIDKPEFGKLADAKDTLFVVALMSCFFFFFLPTLRRIIGAPALNFSCRARTDQGMPGQGMAEPEENKETPHEANRGINFHGFVSQNPSVSVSVSFLVERQEMAACHRR